MVDKKQNRAILKKQLFICLSIYSFIFRCAGSSLLLTVFLAAASEGCCTAAITGFSLRWLLLLQSMGSRQAGFSSCGLWA